MSLLRSLGAVAGAESDGGVDWDAAVAAATAATPAGELDVPPALRTGVAADVDAAAAAIRETTGLALTTPASVELQV